MVRAVLEASAAANRTVNVNVRWLRWFPGGFGATNRWGVTNDMTPLMIAAAKGFLSCVKLLLVAGADSMIQNDDDEHRTALFYAVLNNHPEIVKLLLGAQDTADDEPKPVNTPEFNLTLEQYRLIYEENRRSLMTVFLTGKEKYRRKSLFDIAAERENYDKTLKILLRAGQLGVPGVILARGDGFPGSELLRHLLSTHGNSALVNASQRNRTENMRVLLDAFQYAGAFQYEVLQSGDDAFVAATKNGKIEAMKLLLDRGLVDLMATSKPFDRTPLHHACAGQDLRAVAFLLESGRISSEGIEAKDRQGNTPLLVAVKHYNIHGVLRGLSNVAGNEILRRLLAFPADIYAVNNNREGLFQHIPSVFSIAQAIQNPRVVATIQGLLQERYPGLDVRTLDGRPRATGLVRQRSLASAEAGPSAQAPRLEDDAMQE